MCIPTLIEARRVWPEARVTVLGKRHNRELLTACPFIDEFRECNPDPFSLRRSAEINELERWLDQENFDAAFILLGDQFAHLLARADIPVRVGVKGTVLQSCLTHAYDIGSPRSWGANERLNSLRCLGFDVKLVRPRLWVDENARKTAAGKLNGFGLKKTDQYCSLHPFGSTPRQWWDFEKCRHLAARMKCSAPLRTVLIGGPETAGVGDFSDPEVIDTRGKLTLPELLAVIDDAELVISTDSGPFHIAGALQRPTVGLFRDRRPEHASAYETAEVVFGKDDSCSLNCEWDRCSSDPCRQMSKIMVDDVLAKVQGRA